MTTRKPELSLYLTTYTDGPQHDWRATLELARAMDAAGVDRLVVSDHVVFGENLDAYSDPSIGGQAAGGSRPGPTGLARTADGPDRDRGHDDPHPARHRDPAGRTAASRGPGQATRHPRRAVGRPGGPRRRGRLAARGVRSRGLSFEDRGRLLDHTLEVCQTLWLSTGALSVRGTVVRQHPPDAEACATRRCSGLGQRHGQQGGGTPHRTLRKWLDPVGTGLRRHPWRDRSDEGQSGRARRRSHRSAGAGRRACREEDVDGSIDYAGTAAAVPALAAAGVTDVRFPASLTVDPDRALEIMTSLVEAFRDATR